MDALNPAERRWTAHELAREGVVFLAVAGETRVFGTPACAHLREVARIEVDRRAAAMRPRMRRLGPAPRIVLTPGPHARVGVCGCCGDPMPPYRGGDCALCLAALAYALRAEGRLS